MLVYQPHELETETANSHGLRRRLSKRVEATPDPVLRRGHARVGFNRRLVMRALIRLARPAVVRNISDVRIQQCTEPEQFRQRPGSRRGSLALRTTRAGHTVAVASSSRSGIREGSGRIVLSRSWGMASWKAAETVVARSATSISSAVPGRGLEVDRRRGRRADLVQRRVLGATTTACPTSASISRRGEFAPDSGLPGDGTDARVGTYGCGGREDDADGWSGSIA